MKRTPLSTCPLIMLASVGLLVYVAVHWPDDVTSKATAQVVVPVPVPSNKAPAIVVPAKISGDVGDFIYVTAEADGIVKWFSPDNLRLLPDDLLKDSKTAVVIAPKDGVFRLYAYTCTDGKPTDPVKCDVTARATQEPKPPPDPPPGPPVPMTPFEKAVFAAWQKDGSPKIDALLEVWRQSPVLADELKIVSTDQLRAAIRVIIDKQVGNDLTGTRAVIFAEWDRKFSDNWILTSPFRTTVKVKIAEIVKALEIVEVQP